MINNNAMFTMGANACRIGSLIARLQIREMNKAK